jgi:NAD(P)-dependent dehydrogenase (short-subunit alcohol dehydrogenase family)
LTAIAGQIQSGVPFINVVIANSGTMGPTLEALPKDHIPSIEEFHSFLWSTSMETFNETFMINSTSMFYTMLAFLPLLDAGNKHPSSPTVTTGVKSQFIVTSSIGAFSRRPEAGFAYAGSKAAVIHMMKQMSTNFVPYHIRANVIAPGIYPSDMSTVSVSVFREVYYY